MYKVFIFDFDGTLCSSIASIHQCLCRTFEHFGRPPPRLEVVANMCKKGPSLIESFYLVDPSLRKEDMSTLTKWSEFYRDIYAHLDLSKTHLYPGIEKVLKTITHLGGTCLIVSNKSASSINQTLTGQNCAQFFTHVYGESPRFPPKPDPMLFTHEILPSFPDHTLSDFLMIGDTPVDFYFAERCQIDMVWMDYGYGDISDVDISRIKHRLQNPIDLLSALGILLTDPTNP